MARCVFWKIQWHLFLIDKHKKNAEIPSSFIPATNSKVFHSKASNRSIIHRQAHLDPISHFCYHKGPRSSLQETYILLCHKTFFGTHLENKYKTKNQQALRYRNSGEYFLALCPCEALQRHARKKGQKSLIECIFGLLFRPFWKLDTFSQLRATDHQDNILRLKLSQYLTY